MEIVDLRRHEPPELRLEFPEALFMNGCAAHSDSRTLLICESVTARMLAIVRLLHHVTLSFGRYKLLDGSHR